MAAPEGTANLVSRNLLERLTHYVAPRHAKRTEGRTEQHDCGATVRNALTATCKERPAGKTIAASCGGNGDGPRQIADIPNFGAVIWAIVLREQVTICANSAKIYTCTGAVMIEIRP